MFSCRYCRIFKIICFEENPRAAASIKYYFDTINQQIYSNLAFAQFILIKFFFQNENIIFKNCESQKKTKQKKTKKKQKTNKQQAIE